MNLLPHAEFAYNHTTSETIGCSPFEAIYGMNTNGPLDSSPVNLDNHFSAEVDEQAQFIKNIHDQVRSTI